MSNGSDIFYFTAKERKTVLIIVVLVCALWIVTWLRPYQPKFPATDTADYDLAIAAYLDSLQMMRSPTRAIAEFNVNTVTKSSLVAMGVPEGVAETWIAFREKIGGFRSLDQVRSIYHLDPTWFEQYQNKMILDAPRVSQVEKKASQGWRSDPFDPNTIPASELKDWGFTDFASSNVEKFRAKGGVFRAPSDVARIFGVSEELFQRIKPLIKIHQDDVEKERVEKFVPEEKAATQNSVAKEHIEIDVNRATPYEWQLLPGIGPTYARRIVRFREALGGFITIKQIRETYGLPDSVYFKIQDHLKLTPTISRIAINDVTWKQLSQHPYISGKKAGILINFRENHGAFTSTDDLYRVRIFDSSEIKKLQPYLDFSVKTQSNKANQVIPPQVRNRE